MAYALSTPQLGIPDITVTTTIAPGTSNLPSNVLMPQLGTIVDGWDTTLGSGKFIYLKVPTSTAIAAGLIVTWDDTYTVSAAPTSGSGKAIPCAVCVTAFASNTSSAQYGWFQIQGKATTLKTAVTVSPSSQIYISGTAGRFYVTSSSGKQITGTRTANAATITSTTSSVTVYLEYPLWGGK